jgi:amino acid adenylation domain-containing protein
MLHHYRRPGGKRERTEHTPESYSEIQGMTVNITGMANNFSHLEFNATVERDRFAHDINDESALHASDIFVHEVFEQQVRLTPHSVAIIYENRCLTYTELNDRANQLARYLRAIGIGPDKLVALFVDRSLEMVVGLLGILKAGGAYVPLDPSYPPERVAFMLSDARPTVVLTIARLQGKLPNTAAEMIRLDADWSDIAQMSQSDIQVKSFGLRPDHLAYVIYTSGSTGTPKGVMVEHAGLLNYLQWAISAYSLEADKSVAVSSPLAFDATVTSLYCPLLCGCSVVLLVDGQELDGLVRLLRLSTKWSLIKISPAHLGELGRRLKSAGLPCSVRSFVVGGEALPPSTVDLWRSIWPQTRLINEYGPTETVVGCCAYDIPQDWAAASSVPIGYPIQNTKIHILDEYGRPVPSGSTGEICIGGLGVARGYLNRPQLTAERFVPDLFARERSTRMYCSGDIGRQRPDGIVEYVGRNDEQVKIRGFRIELGEIEAALLGHPAVKQSVVIVRDEDFGEKRLVAYIVGDEAAAMDIASHLAPEQLRNVFVNEWDNLGEDVHETTQVIASPHGEAWQPMISNSGTISATDPVDGSMRQQLVTRLREYLKGRLPEYMLPSYWVVLKQLPLNSNGKTDRRALPVPQNRPSEMFAYSAPRTSLERDLVEIWAKTLRVDQVGIHDNFFELGGHSLLGMRLMTSIAESIAIQLPILALNKNPTVCQMARFLEGLLSGQGGPAAPDTIDFEQHTI